MRETKNTTSGKTPNKEAYIEFVSSLFADPLSLKTGTFLQVGIMAAFIQHTELMIFIPFALCAVICCFWRMQIAKTFSEELSGSKTLTLDDRVRIAHRWENHFVFPSTISAANIGFFSFLAIEAATSTFALSAAFCLLFTPLPTVVGRLYGSRRLASFMLFGLFAPVIIGYFTKGDIQHIILASLCFPYIALVLSMVDNVRNTVSVAVTRNAEKVELSNRFNVALSNMSHGLMMFDAENRIMIINNQASSLFNLPPHLKVVGRSIDVLFRYARRFDKTFKKDTDCFESALKTLLDRDEDRKQVKFDDGRYIELAISERSTECVVMTFEDVTERVLSAKKIENMAQYDGLTRLPNRQHFESLVAARAKKSKPGNYCVLAVVDVDDFKYVNDAIGHAQGDALLCAIARLLQTKKGDSQIVCRLGGDEFLVFIENLETPSEARKHVSKLCSIVSGIHELENEQVFASASIGFVTGPTHDFTLDKAIICADLALYSAKKEQKGSWREFESQMDVQYQRRQRIKKQLGNAVQSEALSLVFQPLVDAQTGRLVSCEALSRWQDEEFGSVSPAEYIPLAEEMGIVTQISGQVLRQATKECAKWPEHICVSVNLSPIDFRTGDILALIDDALENAGLPASRLEIEITETAVMSNEKDMIAKLRAIHERGVRIALDDFGTGQSSLSYLHRLPLDKIKIDRSFVVGIDTGDTPLAVLRGVTDLCRTLNLDVTVEGVETESQLRLVVAEANVDRIQGFIYGPGLPASGIDVLARLGKMPLKDAARKIQAVV